MWTLEKLRQYICWVKETFRPDMSREAEGTLLEYWQMARSKDDRHAARSTVRMLESLVRLSQVHLQALQTPDVQNRLHASQKLKLSGYS